MLLFFNSVLMCSETSNISPNGCYKYIERNHIIYNSEYCPVFPFFAWYLNLVSTHCIINGKVSANITYPGGLTASCPQGPITFNMIPSCNNAKFVTTNVDFSAICYNPGRYPATCYSLIQFETSSSYLFKFNNLTVDYVKTGNPNTLFDLNDVCLGKTTILANTFTFNVNDFNFYEDLRYTTVLSSYDTPCTTNYVPLAGYSYCTLPDAFSIGSDHCIPNKTQDLFITNCCNCTIPGINNYSLLDPYDFLQKQGLNPWYVATIVLGISMLALFILNLILCCIPKSRVIV